MFHRVPIGTLNQYRPDGEKSVRAVRFGTQCFLLILIQAKNDSAVQAGLQLAPTESPIPRGPRFFICGAE